MKKFILLIVILASIGYAPRLFAYYQDFEDNGVEWTGDCAIGTVTSGSAQAGTYKLEGSGTNQCTDQFDYTYTSATTTVSFYLKEVSASSNQFCAVGVGGLSNEGYTFGYDGKASSGQIYLGGNHSSSCANTSGSVLAGTDNGGWNFVEFEITNTLIIGRVNGGSWVSLGANTDTKLTGFRFDENDPRQHLDSLFISGTSPFDDPMTRIISFDPDQYEVILPDLSGNVFGTGSYTIEYFFGNDYPTVDTVQLDFYNYDQQFTYTPDTITINASGLSTVTKYKDFIPGRHVVFVKFINVGSGVVYGDTVHFDFIVGANWYSGGSALGSPQTLQEAIDAFNQQLTNNPNVRFATSGTATTTETFFADFLNVPELLKTRAPFAYFYQMKTILETAVTSTSSTALTTGTYNFIIPTGASSTTIPIDFFSTTTITHFIPSSMQSIMRGLMVAITYIGFGMYLYRRTQRLL